MVDEADMGSSIWDANKYTYERKLKKKVTAAVISVKVSMPEEQISMG